MESLPKNVTRISTLKGTVDATGEEVTVQQYRTTKRKGRRKTVSMMNIDTMKRLQLSNQEYRVLFALLGAVPEKSGTIAYCTLAEIAHETGIHPSNLTKVMKGLRERNIVKTVRRGKHHINSHIAYSGSFDQWGTEDTSEPEPIWHRHGVDPVTGEIL